MIISEGIPDSDIPQAAALYWEAFGAKLRIPLGPKSKAIDFIIRVIDPNHAISAHDANGLLLGVAGFKTHRGALVGGSFSDLQETYRTPGAIWRATLLTLLERDADNQMFLMDGIFVAPQARGRGTGTALLSAVCDTAKNRGHASVRLDVIDTNPRAKALYLREGFTPIKTQNIGVLRLAFGFRSSTTMVKTF